MADRDMGNGWWYIDSLEGQTPAYFYFPNGPTQSYTQMSYSDPSQAFAPTTLPILAGQPEAGTYQTTPTAAATEALRMEGNVGLGSTSELQGLLNEYRSDPRYAAAGMTEADVMGLYSQWTGQNAQQQTINQEANAETDWGAIAGLAATAGIGGMVGAAGLFGGGGVAGAGTGIETFGSELIGMGGEGAGSAWNFSGVTPSSSGSTIDLFQNPDGSWGTPGSTGAGSSPANWYPSTPNLPNLPSTPSQGTQTNNQSFQNPDGTWGTPGTTGAGQSVPNWTSGMTPSALNSLASSLGISPDMLRTLGVGAAGLYGAYTANQSANSMMDLANQYKDFGAEYRARLSALYANPNSFLTSQEVQGPTQLATQGVMRSLSTKVGNPWSNPAALQEAQDYTAMNLFNRLGSEKDRLGTLGGLGAGNAAAPQLAAQAIQAQRGPGDVIGATVGSLLNPPRSVSSYFGLA